MQTEEVELHPSLGFTASLKVRTWQRKWQRKWRDVRHERQALANEYVDQTHGTRLALARALMSRSAISDFAVSPGQAARYRSRTAISPA